MADYLALADLQAKVGAARVLQLFDDDGDGVLGVAELVNVWIVLEEAEGFAYSRMLRAWTQDAVIDLAGADPLFKGHVAWVALELASERRPEFTSPDGKGQFWAQYERAIQFFDALSKNKQRSIGETAGGRAGTAGGNVSPTTTANTAAQFTFAPSRRSPHGHGGFIWPLLFLELVRHAVTHLA